MENEIIDGEEINNEVKQNMAIMQNSGSSLEKIDAETVISNMQAQQEIFKEFLEYVKTNLVAKIDYYTVIDGAKPSLGQPGSEKILDFLREYPRFVVDDRLLSKNEVFYDVTCNLYSKIDNRQMGSGGGFCSSLEDNFLYEWIYEKHIPKNINSADLESRKRKGKDGNWFTQYRIELQNHYNVANTIKKMAYKRAMVDAVVRSTFASHIFTQDLEDSYIGSRMLKQQEPPTKPSTTPQKSNGDKYDPLTYKITGGKYKDELMKDTSTSYIKWNIDQIASGKYNPSKYGIDTKQYLEMLEKCLVVAKKREEGKNKQEIIPKIEELSDEEYKKFQDTFTKEGG